MRSPLFILSILCLTLVCISSALAQRVSALQGLAQDFGQQAQPRGFTLTRLEAAGGVISADAKSVELSLKFTAQVFSPRVQEIPLRLSTCILSGPPVYSSSVGQALSFDSTRGGFLWVIEDESAALDSIQEHVLEIKVIAPITVSADRNEIALRLPMAFESALTLQVPQVDIDARAPRGEEPEIEQSDSGSTIRLANLDRDFSLRWWQTSQEDLSERVIVDEQLFTWLDPIRQLVRHDFQFTVSGEIQQGDTLRVRIPARYEVISITPPSRNVAQTGAIDEEQSETAAGSQQTASVLELEVTADETVRLVCERAVSDFDDLQVDRPALQLESPQVGVWSIAAPQGWLLAPRALPDVVEQVGIEEFARSTSAELPEAGELGLALRYWGNATPVRLQLFRPRKVVTVQPEHSVFAGSNILQLSSTFDINIASGEAHSFDLDLHDWVFEEARLEAGNIALPGEVDDFGILHIPLQRPLRGRLRLVVVASLDVRTNDSVQFELPVLGEASIRSGSLRLLVADDWECVPKASELLGLTAISDELAERFTYQLSGPRSRFVGFLRPLPDFRLSSSVSLDIRPDRTVVRQQLITLAAKTELRGLRLQVPNRLWEQREENGLLFRLNGDVGELVVSSSSPQTDDPEGLTTLEIAPESLADLVGGTTSAATRQVLMISYEVAPEAELSPPTEQTIALAIPANAPFAGHDVSAVSSLACTLRLPEDQFAWKTEPTTADGFLRFRTADAETSFAFQCAGGSRATPGHTVINELVIHSWLGYEFREDRLMFVWQPDAADSELTIKLPAFAVAQCVLRTSSGTARWLEKDEDGAITLVAGDYLQEGSEGDQAVPLELIYRIPGDATGQIQLPPPRFRDDVKVVHTYWHVALPADEHLIWSGQQMQSDNAWNWSSGWKRTPGTPLGSLEARVDAIPAPALPATVNQYLFSGVGLPESLSLLSASRSLIVGTSSLVVLLLGILYLSYTAVRRPSIVLSVLIAFFALAFLFQSVALMFVQASVLGVALLFAAALLRRLVKKETLGRSSKGRDDSRLSNSGLRDQGSTPRTEIRPQPSPTTSS